MKSFEDYKDGDWVIYRNAKSEWHNMQFQAYKSRYTHDAFRLKYGTREVIADITEIAPISEVNKLLQEDSHEQFNSNLQQDSGYAGRLPKGRGNVDSDSDASGFYSIYDDVQD